MTILQIKIQNCSSVELRTKIIRTNFNDYVIVPYNSIDVQELMSPKLILLNNFFSCRRLLIDTDKRKDPKTGQCAMAFSCTRYGVVSCAIK